MVQAFKGEATGGPSVTANSAHDAFPAALLPELDPDALFTAISLVGSHYACAVSYPAACLGTRGSWIGALLARIPGHPFREYPRQRAGFYCSDARGSDALQNGVPEGLFKFALMVKITHCALVGSLAASLCRPIGRWSHYWLEFQVIKFPGVCKDDSVAELTDLPLDIPHVASITVYGVSGGKDDALETPTFGRGVRVPESVTIAVLGGRGGRGIGALPILGNR